MDLMEWFLLVNSIKWKVWLVKALAAKGLNWLCSKVLNRIKKDPIEKAYQEAYKRWDVHFYVKEELKEYKLETFDQFSDYVLSRRDIKKDGTEELFQLFEQELAKKPETSGILEDLRGRAIELGLEDILNEVEILSRTVDSQTVLLKEVYDKLSQHNKGCREFKKPEGYIQRSCSQKINNNDYLRYILEYGEVKAYQLKDIVLGNTECEGNRFILYGDAQSGKTFELKELAYDLKNGGEYVPVLYEVSEHSQLISDLPALDNEHDMGLVLIIDALDERFDGEERNQLYKDINGYAKSHPYLHIVLSCRSNFKGEIKLEGFTPLVLNPLSQEDVYQYLKSWGVERLVEEIEERKYYEFHRVPFYLKALADYYQDNQALPKNKAALYDYYINTMLNTEEKKKLKMYPSMKRKGWNTLQRIAVALQLMGAKSLPQDDLLDLVKEDQETIDRALRSSLLQASEDNYYSFTHNSFKEYFVAKFLLSRISLEKIKELSCYRGTAEVRNEWFNVIGLLLSMLPKEHDLSTQIKDWIAKENKDMVLFVDDDMFECEQKNALFKEILEECKHKNLRFGDFVTSYYEELMLFGYSDATMNYLIKELTHSKEMNNHVVNILFCLRYLQWGLLQTDKKKRIRSVLLKTFARFINHPESAYVLFEPLRNSYLLNKRTINSILPIIKGNEHPNVAKQFVSFVLEANLVEDYLDEIIIFSEHIHNYGTWNSTTIVSRDSLLLAYQKVEIWDNIQKVMQQLVKDVKEHYYYDGSDNRDFNETLSCLLGKAALLSRGNQDIPDSVFAILLELTEDRQGKKLTGKDPFVEFFERTDTTDFYFDLSLQRLKEILSTEWGEQQWVNLRNQSEVYSYCVALFLNEERLEKVCSQYQVNSNEGYNLISYLAQYATEDMLKEIRIIQRNRFPSFWRGPEQPSKWDLRYQRDYNELMDYEKFKGRVLKIVEEKAPQNKDDLMALRKVKIEFDENEYNEISQYVFQVFYVNTNYYGQVNLNDVCNYVNNKRLCQNMMVEATMEILHNHGYSKVAVSEEQKAIFRDASIEWLQELIASPNMWWCYQKNPAISALLNKEVEVGKDMLLQLLPYSSSSIHKSDEGISGREYTLFEMIAESYEGDKNTFINALITCFDNQSYLEEPNLKIWGVYIIKYRITTEYQRVIGWMEKMSDSAPAFCIIQALVKNPETKRLVMSQDVMTKCDAVKRLFIYDQLSNDKTLDEFVRKGVEKEFMRIKPDRKDQALRILLAKGSLMGLRYLAKNSFLLNYSIAMHYQSIEALPLLMKIYSKVIDRTRGSDYMFVLNAIEEIAMTSEHNWKAVRAEFEKKIRWRRKKFIHLNWYIENWDKKIKSMNTPVMSLDEVKRLIS